jgi:CheY-like chemotaxis protein
LIARAPSLLPQVTTKKTKPLDSPRLRLQETDTPAVSWSPNAVPDTRPAPPDRLALTSLLGTETVLVVNPISLARKAMVEAVRQFGYRVLEAGSAVQAQRKVKTCPGIHLLIVDLPELELDEVQIALWFRGKYPSLKILVASASLWNHNYHLGETEQITYCPKPFTAFELARMVRQTLD